jgi:hypothetical protein
MPNAITEVRNAVRRLRGTPGPALGLPLALGGSRILRAIVSDVRSIDGTALAAVVVALLLVVAFATYGPMIRASQVDARTALTAE